MLEQIEPKRQQEGEQDHVIGGFAPDLSPARTQGDATITEFAWLNWSLAAIFNVKCTACKAVKGPRS